MLTLAWEAWVFTHIFCQTIFHKLTLTVHLGMQWHGSELAGIYLCSLTLHFGRVKLYMCVQNTHGWNFAEYKHIVVCLSEADFEFGT